jgi:hypothetical protein
MWSTGQFFWVAIYFASLATHSHAAQSTITANYRAVRDSPKGMDALNYLSDGGPAMERLKKKVDTTADFSKNLF